MSWGDRVYTTANELAYVRDLERRDRLQVLETTYYLVDRRTWDAGIDIDAVRAATWQALQAVRARSKPQQHHHAVLVN